MRRTLLRLWRWICGRCPRCGKKLILEPYGFADWVWECPDRWCNYWRIR